MEGYEPPNYPALKLVRRYGRPLSVAVALVTAGAGLAAAAAGHSVWFAAAGLIAGPVLLLLLWSFVELVDIVADTLMPR